MKTENSVKKSEDSVVLVGIHPGIYSNQWREREGLARKISDAGFKVEEVPVAWPRDHYVFTNGRYVLEKKYGEAGVGGFINYCDDFLIVSERIFGEHKSSSEIKERVRECYPKHRIHIVPAGLNPLEYGRNDDCIVEHTDLTSLLIPSKKLLFVDESFYDSFHAFERAADKEDLTLVRYSSPDIRSCDFFALNCLVLPKNGREIVFVNKNTPSFVKLLRKYDLEVIEVGMSIAPREKWGSIRCCTNTKKPETPLNELLNFKRV